MIPFTVRHDTVFCITSGNSSGRGLTFRRNPTSISRVISMRLPDSHSAQPVHILPAWQPTCNRTDGRRVLPSWRQASSTVCRRRCWPWPQPALFVLAVFNLHQERQFQQPDDGVWWHEASGGLQAERVLPGLAGQVAGIQVDDLLTGGSHLRLLQRNPRQPPLRPRPRPLPHRPLRPGLLLHHPRRHSRSTRRSRSSPSRSTAAWRWACASSA